MVADPWPDLVAEGNFELIDRLQKAERKEPGFCTVVITKKGFSDSDIIHNKVLNWLRVRKIHTLDVMHEVENLKLALKGKMF